MASTNPLWRDGESSSVLAARADPDRGMESGGPPCRCCSRPVGVSSVCDVAFSACRGCDYSLCPTCLEDELRGGQEICPRCGTPYCEYLVLHSRLEFLGFDPTIVGILLQRYHLNETCTIQTILWRIRRYRARRWPWVLISKIIWCRMVFFIK